VPELPDLAILAEAFQDALRGRRVTAMTVPQPLVLRGTPAEMDAFVGQSLVSVERRGKFLTFDFDRDRIVINPMLTGRLGLATPRAKAFPQSAFVIAFAPCERPPNDAKRGRKAKQAWVGDRSWVPADEQSVELRYRDPTKMGKVYLAPAGASRPIAGWEEQAIDADDATLDLEMWRKRISRHSGELKNLLKNQTFVAGIGNGYSDEILWQAGLAPFRKRSSLAADEVDRLYTAMREVLPWAIDELRRRVPPRFEVEVRDFLKVHRKGGQPCPRCGTRLTEVSPGGFVTTWCRGCQR
jgi:formamidopyrimidine-DNA glycosylase